MKKSYIKPTTRTQDVGAFSFLAGSIDVKVSDTEFNGYSDAHSRGSEGKDSKYGDLW